MNPRTQTRPLDEKAMWRDTPIGNAVEVLALARAWFGPVEDPVTPLPGRDPMAQKGTDKGRFFRGDWRNAAPKGLPRASSVSLTNNERGS
jgi:hypothetical protein